ncbi:GTPase-activating protein gyp7 isoform X3 [Hevea brasiliensis]|uniref:GTPase-activating protein gyp7 isoform X3 n=1 Tax=Hevea brasiliensis TaxID=3981 RepID=UPI0025FB3B7B|nr:GTPase-activating protein gyp7 isoform X3 [Hevea brasiliensis]
MWGSGEPADSYYAVRPECTDVAKSRFKIRAGKTLSARKWQTAFSPEGHLDIGKTLSRIQRGGIHPSIRGEVWEILLSCYDPKSTFDEREQIRQRRRTQYARWKEECCEIFPVVGSGRFITAAVITEDGQPIQHPLVILETNQDKGSALPSEDGNSADSSDAEAIATTSEIIKKLINRGPLDKKVIQWLLTLHQIGLDVVRTDRTLVFYEKQENLSKLWDILAVYAWIDTDVGYCQGMSDLCSPMIMLLEDEADAFWCFERLMRRLMMWALEYDPDLFDMYEESESASNKAEGSKGRAKSLRHYGKFERENMKNGAGNSEAPLPISVFLVASVLKNKSAKLLTEARGLDDVVKILNDMTGNLDAKKACSSAMKLHKKYLKKAKKT